MRRLIPHAVLAVTMKSANLLNKFGNTQTFDRNQVKRILLTERDQPN